jgi:hypothetical protein
MNNKSEVAAKKVGSQTLLFGYVASVWNLLARPFFFALLTADEALDYPPTSAVAAGIQIPLPGSVCQLEDRIRRNAYRMVTGLRPLF